MKKTIILILLITSSIGISIYYYSEIEKQKKEIETNYIYLEKEGLIDVNGEINLIEIKTKNTNLKEELKQLIKDEEITEEQYQELIKQKKESNDKLKEDNVKLSNQKEELEKQKQTLNTQYKILQTKYNQLRQQTTYITTSSVTTSISKIENFPLINQYPKYQTGCETVALTMLLRYYGIPVTPDDIIKKLAKESLPYYENGTKYGGNPEVGFVGNPYLNSSYGVYERPIADVANQYKSDIQIKNNYPFDEVLKLVNNKIPVLVWTSMGLSVPYISDSWIYKPTMETIRWKANEHAVVLIGYQGNTVVIADPMGGQVKTYPRTTFEARYNYYGRKALFYL